MPDAIPTGYISGLKVRQRISRQQPKNLPIINMGYNEMPYPPPEPVLAALSRSAQQAHRYGNAACSELRHALAELHGLDAGKLICGNGSEELLDVVARCFVRSDDEILISEFGYIQFSIIAHRLGARLVKVREANYCADVDNILAGVSGKTKLVFLANPNNPTGTMVPCQELARLVRGLPSTVVLVLDLAYGEFVSPDYCARVHELVDAHENVVATRTFSKVYGLAGLRVGWCHAPAWMMGGLYAARGMGSVNAFAQAAGLAALEDGGIVDLRVQQIVAERNRIFAELEKLRLTVVQSQTIFIMCSVREDQGALADALVEYLFDDAGIVVSPVREKGLESFVRFSLSLPEHNDLLVRTVAEFLQSVG